MCVCGCGLIVWTATRCERLTDGVNDLYTIDMTTNTGSILNKQGIIDNFSFNFTSQNPNSLSGSMSFNIGGGEQQ